MLKSTLTGEYFDERDSVRLVNPKQACFYWTRGVKPLSIYPSKNFKTNEPCLVFIFSRTKTKDLYEEWMKKKH